MVPSRFRMRTRSTTSTTTATVLRKFPLKVVFGQLEESESNRKIQEAFAE